MNQPFFGGLYDYMIIPTIYGKMGDGLLLFYPHYNQQ